MYKSRLALKITAILLTFTFLACQKKQEDLKDAADTSSQVQPPISSTTTTTVTTITTSTTVTTTTTTTTTTLPPTSGVDLFKDVSYIVGGEIDKIYSSHRELLVQRGSGFIDKTDFCDPNLKGQTRFADQIAYYVNMNMTARKAQLSMIAHLFEMPTSMDKVVPTSLISHAMCAVDAGTLKQTIGASRVPGSKVIAQANAFVNKYNSLRSKMQSGDKTANLEMIKLWSRMNMCLSYVEALTTADTATSDKVAQKYAPSDYRRPAGVLFYEDPVQTNISRLNIGLFQFSPDSGGNIHTCIKQWNVIYPNCQIPAAGNSADMIRLLGSSYQSFNSFCGTEKPSETFSVQVNTTTARRTHPANWNSDGSLKDPKNRCISLHFLAGTAYNHFGPFQNSTGRNLEELLTCTLAN